MDTSEPEVIKYLIYVPDWCLRLCLEWLQCVSTMVNPVECNYKPSNTHNQTSQTFWSWNPRRWDTRERGIKHWGPRSSVVQGAFCPEPRSHLVSDSQNQRGVVIESFVWFESWRYGCSMFFFARFSFILVIQLGLLRAFPEPLESFPTLIIAAAVSSHKDWTMISVTKFASSGHFNIEGFLFLYRRMT